MSPVPGQLPNGLRPLTERHVSVLVVDDEPAICDLIRDVLADEGYTVHLAHSVEAARRVLTRSPVEILVSDIVLGGPSGNELLGIVKQEAPDTIVLMMTGYARVEAVVDALKHGADDFLLKPFKPADLLAAINRAVARFEERLETNRLRSVAAVQNLGARLTRLRHAREICDALVDAVVYETHADHVSAFVRDLDRQRDVLVLESVRSSTPFPLPLGARVAREGSIVWTAVDRREPISLAPGETETTLEPLLRHPDWGAAVSWPLVLDGETVGVLNVARTAAAYRFNRADLEVIGILSNNAAIALANAHRLKELQDRLLQTVGALADMIEARDAYTRGHSERVAIYSEALGREIGLDDAAIETIRIGALLHDIGKIGIYDSLIRSSDRLSDDEWDQMKLHPTIGARLLRQLRDLDHVIPVVEGHHERYDGGGYPRGLAGEAIPIVARVVAICDAFDAMTSARSYNTPVTLNEAVEELRREAGAQFDPVLVERFLAIAPAIFNPGGLPLAPIFSGHQVDD